MHLLNKHRKALVVATLATTLGIFETPVIAADSQTGAISGRVVSDQSGSRLEGAEVSITARGITVLSARDGGFLLRNVPAGVHRLEVSYTGMPTEIMSVSVEAGAEAVVVVTLGSDVIQLGAFSVTAAREGDAVSIVRQRNADNVKNIVSMDAFGNVADGNIGNFLVRLPGITADLDGGEISTIGIRGTPPEVNTMTVDGARAGNALAGFLNLAGDRAANIDQIPAEFIKEIEVTKAPRPEDPVDSIGGGINLVTKSALDFERDVFTYRISANHNTHRSDLKQVTPNAALTYLTRMGSQRQFGITLSLNYTHILTPRDRVDMQRMDPDGRNTQARTLSNETERIRIGSGLRFDFRMNDTTSMYVKLQYNRVQIDLPEEAVRAGVFGARRIADYNVVSRAQIEAGAIPRTTDNQTAGVAPGFTDTFTELLNASWSREIYFNETRVQQTLAEFAVKKTLPGDQKLTFQTTFSPSRSTSNRDTFVATMVPAIGMTVDTRGELRKPVFRQTYGTSVAYGSDFSRYNATYSIRPERTEETVTTIQGDYTKDFLGLRMPVQIKTGGSWRRQDRTGGLRASSNSFQIRGPDGVQGRNPSTGINDDNLASFVLPGPAAAVHLRGHQPWQFPLDEIDLDAVVRGFRENPSWFVRTATATEPLSAITEDVLAAYLQFRVRRQKLTALGGVRGEGTNVSAAGRLVDSRQPGVTGTNRESAYTRFFPSLHLRYEIRPGLQARASYSTGMGRPRMTELYPGTTVSYDAGGLGTVNRNDPGLLPQYSKNFDLSLEYYFNPVGVASVGVFRKNIRDFLFRTQTQIGFGSDNGFDGEYEGFLLNTTTNAGDAKIEGIEINYNQNLVMLPKPFNGLGIFANYTKMKTSGTFAEGVPDLGGFVPETVNSGISFRWNRVLARVSGNYQSKYLRSRTAPSVAAAGADTWSYSWYRPLLRVDASIEYKINDHLKIFADAFNIGDRWLTWYTGPTSAYTSRVRIVDSYGSRYGAGISGRF